MTVLYQDSLLGHQPLVGLSDITGVTTVCCYNQNKLSYVEPAILLGRILLEYDALGYPEPAMDVEHCSVQPVGPSSPVRVFWLIVTEKLHRNVATSDFWEATTNWRNHLDLTANEDI